MSKEIEDVYLLAVEQGYPFSFSQFCEDWDLMILNAKADKNES